MSSDVWDMLIPFQLELVDLFDQNMSRYKENHLENFNRDGWSNVTWKSQKFRRAHMEVIDARKTHKLWIMHICIFPKFPSGAPIYGFDIISGASKITGTFHDFSPIDPKHPANIFFQTETNNFKWTKERVLPDWAKAIFSSNMLAAGNIKEKDEVTNLIDLSRKTTKWYLQNMDTSDVFDNSKKLYNRYARYQKQNPHTPRTLKSLGISENDVEFFFNHCLFPEL